MKVRLITPPAAEPVTLDMARLHTRAEAAEDDALLTALIKAARQQGEGLTRRVFGDSVWEIETGPLTAPFRLSLLPCTAVESVVVDGKAVDAGRYAFTPLRPVPAGNAATGGLHARPGLSGGANPAHGAGGLSRRQVPGTDPPVDTCTDWHALRAAGELRRGVELQRIWAVLCGLPA